MSMGHRPSLDDTLARFERALTRLESVFGNSLARIGDIARMKGYEEGHRAGLKLGQGSLDTESQTMRDQALKEDLKAAKAREGQLQAAVEEARGALQEAMEDIRAALGML
ncbi:hypothetical protein [Candidatus Phycosocius spiralis]|uniref:Uncharacterized protein n=1 Tax=Candidatus Phycosocius spiralis TaxID=2815099 RepID=A0ABQ4PU72_9PROT|nr:hypothetical protein [Candidatus Phycosocius spiralis]GIU66526.1 hypothetical protein PsB1_0680 [Candidatus Phycosocius spiralis]